MNDVNIKIGTEDVRIKQIAKALSNSERLAILYLISSGEELSHKEIAERINKSESSVSFHIRYFIDSGIIKEDSRKGTLGRIKKVPQLLTKKITIEL